MSGKNLKIEQEKLEALRSSRKTVDIFLRNGYQIHGVIKDFDDEVIIVNSRNRKWMLYRHMLSGIVLEEVT